MTETKKRQPNFTSDELKVLVKGVERNGKVIRVQCNGHG